MPFLHVAEMDLSHPWVSSLLPPEVYLSRCVSSSGSHCSTAEAGLWGACSLLSIQGSGSPSLCQLAKMVTVSSFVSNHKVFPGQTPSQLPLDPTWENRACICSHAVRLWRPTSLEAPCSPFLSTFLEPPGPWCFPRLDPGRTCVPFPSPSSHTATTRTFSGTCQSHTSSSLFTGSLCPCVVESGVTKYTSEDSQDRVQFIPPVYIGIAVSIPRGIGSQQGPWWFRRTRFYTLCYMTGHVSD